MRVTTVSVSVNKMFSDGNYGHQSAQASYTVELENGDDPEACMSVLLARASAQVAVELGHSETLNIRRAVHPRPHVCNYCEQPLADWESYSHKACEDGKRAERDAARLAERTREFAIVGESGRHDADERADDMPM